jgi:hypothetical protein
MCTHTEGTSVVLSRLRQRQEAEVQFAEVRLNVL